MADIDILKLPCCSFCGKFSSKVNRLIAGQDGYICDACVKVCNEILASEKICLFCGKSEEQVNYLIDTSKGHICDKCIEVCNEILKSKLNTEK